MSSTHAPACRRFFFCRNFGDRGADGEIICRDRDGIYERRLGNF